MNEHPFAQYVRILGRGKKGARPLTQEEAYQAMRMILANEVEPVQLGAFLMLLRVKEETPEELAGFVAAARDSISPNEAPPLAQLDWPTYAGKRRQLPWYVLSALLVSQQGIPLLMHGTRGTKDDRLYADDAINALGIKPSTSLDEAQQQLKLNHFAYIELENLCPKLKQIIDLRRLFGLRSPINTLLRMLNPSRADYLIQSTFHPNYRQVHQQAAVLLGQPQLAVFKGEGGEVERNPDGECDVYRVVDGQLATDNWPALFSGRRHLKDTTMDINRLKSVWRGDSDDEYGHAAVTGTAAIAFSLLGLVKNINDAEIMARECWDRRERMLFD